MKALARGDWRREGGDCIRVSRADISMGSGIASAALRVGVGVRKDGCGRHSVLVDFEVGSGESGDENVSLSSICNGEESGLELAVTPATE